MSLHATEPQTKRWTREEFYELAEEGYFRNKRVQLIEGEIIEMAPQGHAHSKALTYLNRWASTAFPTHLIRIQMPLNATTHSDPEPDVAIVPGPSGAYSDHPETAELVIEVSDTSVRLDRRKAKVYALAGVAEYWIVNLPEQQVEVHRRPVAAQARFEKVTVHKLPERISPSARPDAVLSLAELFE